MSEPRTTATTIRGENIVLYDITLTRAQWHNIGLRAKKDLAEMVADAGGRWQGTSLWFDSVSIQRVVDGVSAGPNGERVTLSLPLGNVVSLTLSPEVGSLVQAQFQPHLDEAERIARAVRA